MEMAEIIRKPTFISKIGYSILVFGLFAAQTLFLGKKENRGRGA